ncbi:hypothetical protein DY000_02048309 [Brassica cretica]|uniref:Uncharacterized protein n=1 Tax=Brassica cretica TaxID=69181 RepID=A0ABQ7F3J8_BRACR|nr:hypothetical protein DY000_02048309 [Brassica cretica]
MSNSSLLLGDLKAGGVDVRLLRLWRLTNNKVMQFALCSSTSDEVHHAIFKASKVVYSASYNAYLTLMKILTLQGLAVETVELKGGLLERFTHEMEPFLRKLGMHVQPDIGHVIARCIPTKNTFATTISNIDEDLAQEKCVPRASIKNQYSGRSSKDSDMVEIAPPTFVLGSTTLEIQKEQDSDHDQGENQKLSLYQALSLKTLLADYLLLIAYEVKCMNNKKASFCIPRIG